MRNLGRNWPEEKRKVSVVSSKVVSKKIKAGDLVRVNTAFDFLWRGSKKKDHFDLYVPIFEEAIVLVLKPYVLCGDFRYSCRHLTEKNILDYPEFYKNLKHYDIVTPLTPCVEVLRDKEILYLECELFLECLRQKWVEIISR